MTTTVSSSGSGQPPGQVSVSQDAKTHTLSIGIEKTLSHISLLGTLSGLLSTFPAFLLGLRKNPLEGVTPEQASVSYPPSIQPHQVSVSIADMASYHLSPKFIAKAVPNGHDGNITLFEVVASPRNEQGKYAGRIIVIDSGHFYDANSGASYSREHLPHERDLNRYAALKAVERMTSQGATVVLDFDPSKPTQPRLRSKGAQSASELGISLQHAIANGLGNRQNITFLSLHHNTESLPSEGAGPQGELLFTSVGSVGRNSFIQAGLSLEQSKRVYDYLRGGVNRNAPAINALKPDAISSLFYHPEGDGPYFLQDSVNAETLTTMNREGKITETAFTFLSARLNERVLGQYGQQLQMPAPESWIALGTTLRLSSKQVRQIQSCYESLLGQPSPFSEGSGVSQRNYGIMTILQASMRPLLIEVADAPHLQGLLQGLHQDTRDYDAHFDQLLDHAIELWCSPTQAARS